jgi:hypothetical protein
MSEAYLIFIENSDPYGIDDGTLEDVQNKIGTNEADHLYLIIESVGGSPFASVAIMNILNSRFKKISAVVPRFAKSAATLMSLGTDEIYMCERSALGPLDLPKDHPIDGSPISSMDIKKAVADMAALSQSIAKDRYDFLTEKKIPRKDAAQIALNNANDFLRPLIQQVDPYHLQKAQREQRIGYWYAIDMLTSRMMANDFKKAQDSADFLVNSFPAHEYSIFANDAEGILKLNIKSLKDLPQWENDLKIKYLNARKNKYFVEFGIIKHDEKNEKSSTKIKEKKG